MTVLEFSSYSIEAQYQMLKRKGVFLMTRSTQFAWVVLFAFEGFYVEVARAQCNGKIKFIRGFTDIRGLNPYLSQINITPIIND